MPSMRLRRRTVAQRQQARPAQTESPAEAVTAPAHHSHRRHCRRRRSTLIRRSRRRRSPARRRPPAHRPCPGASRVACLPDARARCRASSEWVWVAPQAGGQSRPAALLWTAARAAARLFGPAPPGPPSGSFTAPHGTLWRGNAIEAAISLFFLVSSRITRSWHTTCIKVWHDRRGQHGA